ncbi:MAG: glucose-6-phosphate isomerase, partial [Bacilli bacterium]|nr:glucose-6-phosphate isomerase [Bacilli bacterium]
MIKLDLSHVIEKIDFTAYQEKVNAINQMIDERTGPGNDFLGWTTWPNDYDKEEVAQIKRDASYVRQNFEVLVVCGIGGSYLGARSAIDALRGLYSSA